jgi:selenocysteine lyase/cysteine desulfurase
LQRLATSTAFLPAAVATLAELRPALAATAGVEGRWELVRQQFPFSEEKVPINAANLCPSPRAVTEQVVAFTHDIDNDCSFNNRNKFKKLLEESRSKVAAGIGADPDEVALVRNTSEANNTINNGMQLGKGDEVVIWEQNHPTNNVAWDVRAARRGFIVKRVTLPKQPKSEQELVDAFEAALTSRTRVLSITHVSNLSGIRLPAKAIGAVAKKRGLYFHVDGAQSWGAVDVDVKDIGCDSYTASSHKWFCGPREVGLLYVKKDRIDELWPNVVAPGWGTTDETILVGARKFESLGQRDDSRLAAVGTMADMHAMLGPAAVEARMYALVQTLKKGLHDAGAKLVTPMDEKVSGGVCIVEVPQQHRADMVNALYDKHGIAGAMTGGLRLCPHLYNTMEHVERAVAGVKDLKKWLA